MKDLCKHPAKPLNWTQKERGEKRGGKKRGEKEIDAEYSCKL